MSDVRPLVDPVGLLWSFLPPGCRRLGQQDLNIVGTYPIDAGGFADVWAGEMGDQRVAIKSYRHCESTGCALVCMVSHRSSIIPDRCAWYTHQPPTDRGLSTKRGYTLTSRTTTWCHSSEFTPVRSTRLLSSSPSWKTSTLRNILETTAMPRGSNWYVIPRHLSPIIFSVSRRQLLGMARGVKAMHSLDIVHGNLKIV